MTELDLVPASLPAELIPARRQDENPYFVYLTRFSGESQRTMRGCLDRIAAIILRSPAVTSGLGAQVRWEQLRYPHVALLRTEFTERWSSLSHVNKHLSALRGVLREAWRLGLMAAEDFQRAEDVENVKGSREGAGRNIHADQIAAMLAVCLADERPLHAARDAALVALLQSTGMRRAETAAARIERYDHGERSMRVIGKGNKERTVYVHEGAVPYLDRWLVVVGARRGPIFRGIDRWANIGDDPLSARAVGFIVNLRCEQAGLPALSTHDFRRTFIGDFIDAGGDLVQAQKLAGHASATTTASYDRRPGRALRTAVDRLSLPSPDQLARTRNGGSR